MRIDVFLTKLSIVFGAFGIMSWLMATALKWAKYGIPRFSADDWLFDAIVLLMVAVWLSLGALYHKPRD